MKKWISFCLSFLLMGSSVGVRAESSLWNKILPSKKDPQVLQDVNTKQPAPVAPAHEALNLQDSFAKVVDVVKPAVVNISAVQITKVQSDPHQFFFGDPNEFFYRFFGETPQNMPPQKREREFRSEGTGSGVIIDPEGYILTNNHVVQNASQLTVTLSTGKQMKGSVVGTDPRTDLAIIRIKGSAAFPYVPLGDSAAMRIGDWVLAFGSPFGLEQTVTAGIVSAIRQSLNIEGRTFANLIQTDAAINRGNSGGPLVNIRGEVIGINTAIYAPTGVFSGIGFAIPVNEAKKILQDLIKKGFVERSWMGVEIAEIDEIIAQQFGLKNTEGALVNQVVANSPAQKAGIQRGDVISEINGKKIKNVGELQDIVGSTPPNTTIKLKIIRNDSSRVVSLKTELMPKQQASGDENGEEENEDKNKEQETGKWLGASFSELNSSNAQEYDVSSDEAKAGGLVVVNVPADSDAAEAGLVEGDVIRAINRQPVATLKDLKRVGANADLKKGIVVDVLRGGHSFYLSYKSLQ